MNGREMCAQAGQSQIVTVRKPYFKWLGSLHMAIFLDEMLFREGSADGDEWEMTDAELSDKLCLTVDAVKRCRAEMVGLGFLSVERRGLPCRSFYRTNTDAIAAGFTAFLETGTPVSGKPLTSQRKANVKGAGQRETASWTAENRSPTIYTGVKAGKDVKTESEDEPARLHSDNGSAHQPSFFVTEDDGEGVSDKGMPSASDEAGHEAPLGGMEPSSRSRRSPSTTPPPPVPLAPPSPWDAFYAACATVRGDGRGARRKDGKPHAWIGQMARATGTVDGFGTPERALHLLRSWYQDKPEAGQGWVRRVSDPLRIVADFGGWMETQACRRAQKEWWDDQPNRIALGLEQAVEA